MSNLTNPTILNPNYVIELRNTGRLFTELADSLVKLSGISIGGIKGFGSTTGHRMSEATRNKMRLAAKRRHRAKVQEIRKAA